MYQGRLTLAALAATLLCSQAQGSVFLPGNFSNLTGQGSFDLSFSDFSGAQFGNATATFNFLGLNAHETTSTVQSEQGHSWRSTTLTNNHSDSLDQAQVSIAGTNQIGSNAESYYSHSTQSTQTSSYTYLDYMQNYTYAYRCGWFGSRTCYASGSYPVYGTGTQYQHTLDNYFGYAGPFSLTVALDSSAFSSLHNGLLPFSFTGLSGAVELQSAMLEYSVLSPVAEPEQYILMLSGLALLGYMGRRKKLKTYPAV